jgi:hypothetical protein
MIGSLNDDAVPIAFPPGGSATLAGRLSLVTFDVTDSWRNNGISIRESSVECDLY